MFVRRFNQENRILNKYSTISPRDIVRDHGLEKRYKDKEATLLRSSGDPFIWFRSVKKLPCYCFSDATKSGNINDLTCHGTGYLQSYEKYGYETYTFAKTHPDLSFDNVQFIDGWGYKEIMTINEGTSAAIIFPAINTTRFKEFASVDINLCEAKAGFNTYMEFSYDNVIWMKLECPTNVDLSMGIIYFRLIMSRIGEPPHGGIRFVRFRFREKEFSLTRDALVSSDVYIPISTDKFVDNVQKEREKIENTSEFSGWTLNAVRALDFVVDAIGIINKRRVNGVYLLDNIQIGSHDVKDDEYRRDFDLKFIPKNGYLRNLYTIPL